MIFGFGKPHFLGIDFGTASIKAVELSIEDNQPVLINYGQVNLEEARNKKRVSDEFLYDGETSAILRMFLERMKPKSDSAYVAMPSFIGLTFFVEFPIMEEDDLENAVRFEAHKYIPASLEDIALSWEVVNVHTTPEGEKMGVLLVTAPNKDVARFERYVIDAGLAINFLELETFSLSRSIVGDKPGVFIIIDMGFRATNIILIDDGVVKASHSMNVGGKDISHTFVESFGITFERAEIMKKSGKDFFIPSESTLVFPSLQLVATEVNRMYTSYQAKHKGVECRQVFLSGGGAQFAGLVKYYSNLLKMPVSIGNPWKSVKYDPILTEKIQGLGTSFSVAIGLALSGTDTILNKKTELLKKSKKDFSLKGIFMNESNNKT